MRHVRHGRWPSYCRSFFFSRQGFLECMHLLGSSWSMGRFVISCTNGDYSGLSSYDTAVCTFKLTPLPFRTLYVVVASWS